MNGRRHGGAWAIILSLAFIQASLPLRPSSTKGAQKVMAIPQEGRVRAPELTGARGWLNTDKPLSLAALKGKVVLLDFWTYGCINCIHIIPDLKKLEAKYANQLVVIGVHSAKFENEKETENIRRIILRYEIEHPVVNDAEFDIWTRYRVRAWPTQVLIDPAGYVVGSVSGEGHYDLLDNAIGQTAEEFRKRGELNEQPLSLALERAKTGDLPLAFPGKVLADEKSDRLFIADSNHNRVVVTRLDGTLLEIIGTGERGSADGEFARASFYRPQGMALDHDSLYVADTENHLVRRVDLKARKVETVAGTGRQMSEYGLTGPARAVPLNSPWDLQLSGRTLYIAMAGPHQIWKLDLDKQEVQTFAGSGREARIDGELAKAGFAQPSGLALEGKTLFVADSESNIVRAIDTGGPAPSVRTLAGGDLFEFGDEDGAGDDVRLQHPLGLAALGGKILIADTYNHKIKQLDPRDGTVKTLFGTGKPGQADGAQASFYEPGGLSVAGGKLYVADTNNHAVRVVDLKTKRTATLMLKGLQPPAAPEAETVASDAAPNSEEIKLAPQRLRAKTDGALVVDVALPAGYHLNPSAPQRYQVSIEGESKHLALGEDAQHPAARTSKDLRLPLRIPLRALTEGAGALRVRLTLYYCREDNTGTCQIKTLVWRAPVEVTADADAPREVRAQGKVEAQ
ncbi:MAG TPA: thioredoxin-like domain-containing protein [Pyrinomonadaceae bacterium]|nr:thioredoxin-like domain-containing protein [Pyrinomonadaceae bacterium]